MPINALSQEQLNHDSRLLKINSENFQGNIQIIMRLTNTCLYRLIHVHLWYAEDSENKKIAKRTADAGIIVFTESIDTLS